MSAPSLIWMPGSASLTPAALHAVLVSIFGAELIGLWIGEDLVIDGGNEITSWPGRIGPTLNNATVRRFSGNLINNRQGFRGATSTGRSLFTASIGGVPAKSIISVAEPTALPCPAGVFSTLAKANTASAGEALAGNGGTSNWYVAEGWNHFKNGAASEVITSSGLTVYEGDKAVSVTAGFRIGGYMEATSLLWDWTGTVMFGMALSAVPSASKRSAATSALRSYYKC